MNRSRLAVIGSGISGLATAHILSPHHDVVLMEASDRLGGHTNTITVDDPTAGELGIDTGFIVHNDRNYPNLLQLFDELGVATQDSEMSFGVTDRDPQSPTLGLTYRATNLNTLFADRHNLGRPAIWKMLYDIVRFYRHAKRFLAQPDESVTIDQFLEDGGYGRTFVELHLVAMGAAVWSADPQTFGEFPALSLLRFLDNHGLLSVGNRPRWRTVTGGSSNYIAPLIERFQQHGGQVWLQAPVQRIERTPGGVTVTYGGPMANTAEFDRVIVCVHSDQALAMLAEPTAVERNILEPIRYQPNTATLHTDETVMPAVQRAWAAWNYDRRSADQRLATLTYDMTLLQRLPGRRRYFVSLNSDKYIDDSKVIASFDYAHPVFDTAAVKAQTELDQIDRADPIQFAGAWCGYGFHEDGIAAAVRACERAGVNWGPGANRR